jgi:hypothetical protein
VKTPVSSGEKIGVSNADLNVPHEQLD